jgi:hypothetical protein
MPNLALMKRTWARPRLFHPPGDSPSVVPGQHSPAHVLGQGGVQADQRVRDHPRLGILHRHAPLPRAHPTSQLPTRHQPDRRRASIEVSASLVPRSPADRTRLSPTTDPAAHDRDGARRGDLSYFAIPRGGVAEWACNGQDEHRAGNRRRLPSLSESSVVWAVTSDLSGWFSGWRRAGLPSPRTEKRPNSDQRLT